jgi:hypothetical protein
VFGGSGVIVLNKVEIPHKVAEGGFIPRLKEEPPSVAIDLRLQKGGIVDFGGEFLHGKNGSWKLAARSLGIT